jgi:succinoglycan biosynthesis protein ExoM
MLLLDKNDRKKVSVGICITTYRRRELLRRLLAGLADLKFDKMPPPDINVIVVDNDAGRTGEESCREVKLPWDLKYVVESRRGVAQARNRALLEAEDPDYIAFIDDDEFPTSRWLDELLWTRACFKADVVCGPILPSYAAGVPEWIKDGTFFSRHVYATGYAVETCSTGNVLITRRVVNTVQAFDERFSVTGGEDAHFFRRARQAGFEIVCSGGGIVYENVPPSRGCLHGILRRAYQAGNSSVLCESSLDRRRTTRVIQAMKACGRILRGSASACAWPICGRGTLAKGLKDLFVGAGMLSALAGKSFQAYPLVGTDPAK